MAAVGGEAGDTGGNAQLAETICDPAFKEYLFWTLKDDDERIRKILKTLLEALRKTFPERDESATTQSMEMTNNENSPREVDWLKRIMTFRKLIIDEVKKKGKMEGDVRSFSQMALLYEQDNVLAQWLYNGGNINNAKCAWNSIKGLGGFDDPSKDLRESVRIGLMKLYDARRDPATNSLRPIECDNNRAAYYIGECNFRHRGRENGIPPRVHITAFNKKKHTNVVRVFFSGSGTGKTVELATSAESRGAVITLMHEADGDIATADPNGDRTSQCRTLLKTWVDTYLKNDGEVLSTIANTVKQRLRTLDAKKQRLSDGEGATTGSDAHLEVNDDRIRIVFAIDEAARCSSLSKEIIRNFYVLGRDLGYYIMNKATGSPIGTPKDDDGGLPRLHGDCNIEVVFSIAGTGMYGGAVGSQGDNFVCLESSAKKDPKEVYEALCKEYDGDDGKSGKLPTYEDMMKTPFLSIIASHNARMASILVNQLAESVLEFNPNDEMRLVSLVFDRFARSNGLKKLWHDRDFKKLGIKRALAVARALAILLYQTEFVVPLDIDTAKKHARDLDYGINFEKFGDKDINIMNDLVTEYGLVTPEPFKIFDHIIVGKNETYQIDPKFKEEQELEKPFIVDEAIQLFCVWLLEGGSMLTGRVGFLGTTPFAYEALSTQIIGAAITAAKTVSYHDRKSIQSILKDTLKMKLKPSRGVPDKPDRVKEAWDALEGVKPISVESELAMDGMHHQRSEMSLNEPTIPTKPDGFHLMSRDQVVKWEQKEISKRVEAQKTRVGLNRWAKLINRQIGPNFASDPHVLFSKLNKLYRFDASHWETLIPTFDMDWFLAAVFLRTREACANLEDAENSSKFDRTKQIFCPSLTTVAEGSSNLADGYVSTAGVRKITDSAGKFVKSEVGFFTVCIQAKDYFDSSTIEHKDIRKNRDRIHHSLLDITFGLNRLYCVASRKEKLRLGSPYKGVAADGTSFYAGFPTDESPLLSESMDKLDLRRSRSEKICDNSIRLALSSDMNEFQDFQHWLRMMCDWFREYLSNLETPSESDEESMICDWFREYVNNLETPSESGGESEQRENEEVDELENDRRTKRLRNA